MNFLFTEKFSSSSHNENISIHIFTSFFSDGPDKSDLGKAFFGGNLVSSELTLSTKVKDCCAENS